MWCTAILVVDISKLEIFNNQANKTVTVTSDYIILRAIVMTLIIISAATQMKFAQNALVLILFDIVSPYLSY